MYLALSVLLPALLHASIASISHPDPQSLEIHSLLSCGEPRYPRHTFRHTQEWTVPAFHPQHVSLESAALDQPTTKVSKVSPGIDSRGLSSDLSCLILLHQAENNNTGAV